MVRGPKLVVAMREPAQSDRVAFRVAWVHMTGVTALILAFGLVPWGYPDTAADAWPVVPFAICSICYSSCALTVGWIRRRGWGGWSIQSCLAMANLFNPVAFWRARRVLGWSAGLAVALLASLLLLIGLAQWLLRR